MKMPIYYYHVIAFVAGFILDCILGDPHSFPHPVKLIGRLISFLETKYLGKKQPVQALDDTEMTRQAGEGEQSDDAASKEAGDDLTWDAVPKEAGDDLTWDAVPEEAGDNLTWDAAPKKEDLTAEAYDDELKEEVAFAGTTAEVLEELDEDAGEAAVKWDEFDWSQQSVKKSQASESTLPKQSEEKQAEEEKPLTAEAKRKREQGRTTVLLVLLCTVAVTDAVFMGSYVIHPIFGCVIETILTYQILAAKCLCVESMKVYKALKTGTIEDARKAVSMIVGRDTAKLDEEGVTKAAVETVAENTSDGVIAPMLYLAIGGPILGMAYKAINTMDSMIGYKNERYLDFGRAAAKLDDVVNFLPSRISAWLMIIASYVKGDPFIGSEAKRIYLRDRMKHSSPNSAQTESACAGALGIQLAGDASYFGKIVHKPTIGDARRKITAEDIPYSNQLMYAATILCLIICIGLMVALCFSFFGGLKTIQFMK